MANYIGNQPSYGEFKRLDSISSSFDGSTTQFSLAYNSVSTSVGDASQLIVSLNGIVQEPLNSYTLGVGGSSVVFASAPASGDTCFIMYIGGAGGTVTTISDGAVTASKLDASLKDYYEDEFTANGSITDFTLSRESVGVNQLLVSIDGIVQPTSAYTASGTTFTVSPALPNGTNIRVVHMGAKAGVFVPQSGSVGLNELDLTGVDTRYYTQTAAVATFETISNVTNGLALKAPIANPSFTGNVGIGTSSPSSFSGNASNLVVGSGSGTEGITINSGTGNYGVIYFADGTSGSAAYAGNINYNHADNSMRLGTNGDTTDVVIDSSGNVGIGTANPGTVLHVYNNAQSRIGMENSARRFDIIADGDGLTIRDQSAAVNRFTINTSGNLVLGNSGVSFNSDRLQVESPAGEPVASFYRPRNTGGGGLVRFMSDVGGTQTTVAQVTSEGNFNTNGGINFGSTGGSVTSKTLDDYEEGTWTPTVTQSSTAPSVSYTNQTGGYVKVGRLIYCSFDLTASSVSGGSGSVLITGLPYLVTQSSYFAGYSVVQWRDAGLIPGSAAGTQLKGFAERGQAYIYLQYDNSGSSSFNTNSNVGSLNGAGRATGYIIYATN